MSGTNKSILKPEVIYADRSKPSRQAIFPERLTCFRHPRRVNYGKTNLIFCRNVIIFFDPAAKKRVIESVFKTLYEGGYLPLGHPESLMKVTTQFILRQFKNDMMYQKPEYTAGMRP